MAPLVSHVQELGLMESRSVGQRDVFAAGVTFAKAEGIIPAPEASHAIAALFEEAILCREQGISKSILVNLSGHGHFDMAAYENYFSGKMQDFAYSDADLQQSLKSLPNVDWPPKAA